MYYIIYNEAARTRNVNRKMVSFRLPPEVVKALQEEANRQGISRTELIEKIIEKWAEDETTTNALHATCE